MLPNRSTRPALQRLGQQRVVGVGDAGARRVDGRIETHAVTIGQQQDQLRNGDRRMGVVELDRDVLGQRREIAVLVDEAADQVLQRCRGKEIFLLEPQLLAFGGRIVRVEDARDRLGQHPPLGRLDELAAVETVEIEHLRRLRRPQAQRVDVLAAPARDRRVIGLGENLLARPPDRAGLGIALDEAAEPDRIDQLRPLELPGVAHGEPVLDLLGLPAVAKALPEQAVLVADAVAVGGDRRAATGSRESRRRAGRGRRCRALRRARSRAPRRNPRRGRASAPRQESVIPRLAIASRSRRPIRNSIDR